MIAWTSQQLADAAGATLLRAAGSSGGPTHAVIGSAEADPGALFVGLPGTRVDGGRFAPQALEAGAWGVLVGAGHEDAALGAPGDGAVVVAADPLLALQRLATAWRRELGAATIGVTGSTGKTTTKELIAAMASTVAPTHATKANLNTEIGLPLTVLAAPPGTKVLVLEMGMRGAGQIAELAAIAEPDVGVVVNVGPAHIEQLGSIEAIADEKTSLLHHLRPGGTAVVPVGDQLIAARRPADVRWVTFGDGGDVSTQALDPAFGLGTRAAHVRLDAAAALAAVRAVGLEPTGPLDAAATAGRGAELAGIAGSTVIDDCYNANPMSMQAALQDLAERPADRLVAVLGDMLELGDASVEAHRELGEQATQAGVTLLATVGERAKAAAERFDRPVIAFDDAAQAAAVLPALIEVGDAVLVKGSRGVGLEVVVDALSAEEDR